MSTSLEQSLRDAGLKVTGGRIALLDALKGMPHSDAESLRQSLPGISIQSVHNILADLADAGVIRRIEPAGFAARYERRIDDNHHHVVCTSCNAIADVDCAVGHAPCLTPSDATGFTIHAAEVTYWGLCAQCQPNSSQPTPGQLTAI